MEHPICASLHSLIILFDLKLLQMASSPTKSSKKFSADAPNAMNPNLEICRVNRRSSSKMIL